MMRVTHKVCLTLLSLTVWNMIPPLCCLGADPPAAAEPIQHDTVDGKTPKLKIGTAENLFDLGAEEKMLAWEKWHARVGNILSKRVNKAAKKMLGLALVRITVQRDHRLVAELVSASPQDLGGVCVSAAQTLDGDPLLEFPAESKRDAIAFRFQYKRGLLTLPGKHFIKDDYEKMER
jgi:hypothetical protein